VARVVDLERHKVERLAAQIERQLADLPPMSRLHVPLSEVDDPQRWRRARGWRRTGWAGEWRRA
jgi:hypothetical protein